MVSIVSFIFVFYKIGVNICRILFSVKIVEMNFRLDLIIKSLRGFK